MSTQKSILITGGTGFIGKALGAALSGLDRDVIVLTRNPDREGDRRNGQVRYLAWDGRTARGWGGTVEGAWAVVNLAGESLARGRWTRRKKEAILGSRLRAGAAVVEAIEAAKEKPAVLVQSSAVGFYGPGEDEELDESAVRGEGFLAAVAGKWEESTAVVESWGVRRVVIRTGLVLDPRGGVLPRLALPFRFYAGGPVGTGRQWFPWISLEDEVRAILFLMDRKDLRGAFNLSAPGILRQRDFSRVLGRALRRPSWLRVPTLILKLAFGEKSRETLLVGQKAAPRRLLEAGFKFLHPEAEEALSELLR